MTELPRVLKKHKLKEFDLPRFGKDLRNLMTVSLLQWGSVSGGTVEERPAGE